MEQLTEKTIYRIINAESILDAYQEVLEEMYVADYGSRYRDLIHKRLENTICITTSTPDFDYQFIKKYHQEDNIQNMDIVTNDYINYSKLKEEITTKCSRALYNLICKYLDIDENKYPSEIERIINLPFNSYCSATNFSKKNNSKVIDIKNLVTMQKKYLSECESLGIKPLLDNKKIDKLLEKMSLIMNSFYHELLTKSSFIDNLRYSIFSITKTAYTKSDLSILLGYPAACTILLNKNNNEILRLIYLPLAQIACEGYNIDNFLLHEFRHAIEASIAGIGLDEQGKLENYHLFNELRTELHAKEDLKRVETIFGRSSKYSGYYQKTPFIENLIYRFGESIDDMALNNNFSMLEKLFTRKELVEFEDLLDKTLADIDSYALPGMGVFLRADKTDIDRKIVRLSNIALENGIRSYQKHLVKNRN